MIQTYEQYFYNRNIFEINCSKMDIKINFYNFVIITYFAKLYIELFLIWTVSMWWYINF